LVRRLSKGKERRGKRIIRELLRAPQAILFSCVPVSSTLSLFFLQKKKKKKESVFSRIKARRCFAWGGEVSEVDVR